VKEDKQVRFVVTRLRGHASLWWDGVQEERILKNKARINSWSRMTAKLKGKFLPKDYNLILFRQMQNLKKKSMTVREYTEEFYKVNIKSGHIEDTLERVARYANGLRFDIQDELSLLSLKSVEEAYQIYMKVEEKLMRKQSQRMKVRSSGGKEHQQKGEASSSNQQVQPDRNNENRGGRNASRGRGGQVRCYTCGQLGHMSWDCPENVVRQRGAQVVQVEPEAPKELEVIEDYPEQGEALLMRKVIDESAQRRSLFKTVCKVEGKCCKLIIDSGSTDNLVSTEMVDKLKLKKTVHPEPYRVVWLQEGHQVLVREQC
jgi:hypothetical protein